MTYLCQATKNTFAYIMWYQGGGEGQGRSEEPGRRPAAPWLLRMLRFPQHDTLFRQWMLRSA